MDYINQDLQASYNIIKLLEDSNERSEIILNWLPGIFAIVNSDFEILRGNQTLTTFLSTDLDGLLRRSISEIFDKQSWNIFSSQVEQLTDPENISDCVDFELAVLDADMLSGEKPHYWHIRKLSNERFVEGDLFIIIGEDISQLRESEKNLSEIFASIPLGIFTIDSNGIIEDFHSNYLEYLLCQKEFNGKSIEKILFDPAKERMSPEELDGIHSIFFALGKGSSQYHMLESFFPKRLFYAIDSLLDKGRWLEVTYQPVYYDGRVKRLLIIVEDKTEVIKAENLKKEAQLLGDRNIKRFLELKQVDSQGLPLFMQELSDLTQRLENEVQSETPQEKIYGTLHGIKGIARVAGFTFLKELVHDLETTHFKRKTVEIDSLKSDVELVVQEFEELRALYCAVYCSKAARDKSPGDSMPLPGVTSDMRLQELFGQYIALLSEPFSLFRKFKSFRLFWGLLSFHYAYASTIEDSLRLKVAKTANKLKKHIKLHFDWGNVLLNNNLLSAISECMLHVLNNAIDHGIEAPEERIRSGKESSGNIYISMSQKAGLIECRVSDDGAGIDVDHIRTRAFKKRMNNISQLVNMEDSEILQLVLNPGFSTANEVTDVSGRGIGLDAAMNKLEEYCGFIEVDSQLGRGSTFTLSAHHYGNDDLNIRKKCYSLSYFKNILTSYTADIETEHDFMIKMEFAPEFDQGVFYGDLEKSVVALTSFLGKYAAMGIIYADWQILDDCYINCNCKIVKSYSEERNVNHFKTPIDFCKHFIVQHNGTVDEVEDAFGIRLGFALHTEHLPKLVVKYNKESKELAMESTVERIKGVASELDTNIEFTTNDEPSNMCVFESIDELQKKPKLLTPPGFVMSSCVKSIRRDMLMGLESMLAAKKN